MVLLRIKDTQNINKFRTKDKLMLTNNKQIKSENRVQKSIGLKYLKMKLKSIRMTYVKGSFRLLKTVIENNFHR